MRRASEPGAGRPRGGWRWGLAVALGLCGLTGCETPVPPAALAMKPQTLEMRQMQSRRYETADEKKLLAACAALLQDLGFNIEESCSELGLVVASKNRSAVETGQVVGSFLAALVGVNAPYDTTQKFRASIVTRPSEDRKSVIVRVTFQRTVWNTQKAVSRNEPLNKPEQYQEFFQKLSKSVLLDANDL
jgi:hypothetical protein